MTKSRLDDDDILKITTEPFKDRKFSHILTREAKGHLRALILHRRLSCYKYFKMHGCVKFKFLKYNTRKKVLKKSVFIKC